jgi:hypothetical protein
MPKALKGRPPTRRRGTYPEMPVAPSVLLTLGWFPRVNPGAKLSWPVGPKSRTQALGKCPAQALRAGYYQPVPPGQKPFAHRRGFALSQRILSNPQTKLPWLVGPEIRLYPRFLPLGGLAMAARPIL